MYAASRWKNCVSPVMLEVAITDGFLCVLTVLRRQILPVLFGRKGWKYVAKYMPRNLIPDDDLYEKKDGTCTYVVIMTAKTRATKKCFIKFKSDFNIYGKEFWDCVLQTKVPSIIFQLMKLFLYLVDYGGHELLYTERGQHSQQFLSYQLCHWGLLSLSIFFLRVKVKTC